MIAVEQRKVTTAEVKRTSDRRCRWVLGSGVMLKEWENQQYIHAKKKSSTKTHFDTNHQLTIIWEKD